ncbi:MAG: XrtA system polysaccharide chain length determinant [Gammaproteobacteria bacterium]
MDWQLFLEKALGSLRGIWRYRWHGLLTVWIIAMIGWIGVAMLPDRYQAEASIYVDTESLLKPLMKDLTVSSDVDERIQQTSRTLLTRPNIERIAKMADLDLSVNTPEEKELLLDKLERQIKLVREGRSNLFTITYENRNPKTAKLVVQSVLNLFIEATLSDKRTDTTVAQKFLDEQIDYYQNQLIKAEENLARFKRENIGTLPNEDRTYYEALQRILSEKEATETELAVAQSRKEELAKQLRGEVPTFGLMGDGGPSLADPQSRRIEVLKENLNRIKLVYTDNHPTVKRMQEQIKRLSEPSSDAELPAFSLSEQDNLDQNPVYQEMKIALSEASASVAEIQARLAALDKSSQELKQKVDKVIQAETELANLNRGYLIDKGHYQTLLERKEAAKLSESLDTTAGTVDFRVVDPPFVPSQPTGPNRFLFSIALFFIALVVGVGAAFARSQVTPAFYDKISVIQQLNLPILATVPKVKPVSLNERKHELKKMYAFSLGCLMLVVILALYNVVYIVKA